MFVDQLGPGLSCDRLRMRVIALSVATAFPLAAAAAVTPELSANWTQSSNFTRSTTTPDSGSQTLIRAGVDVSVQKSAWNVELRAATERIMYGGQDLDDGKRYGVYLRSEVLLIPERVTWELLDDLGLVATDPFGDLNPSDLQRANLLSTGPNLFLPMGVRNRAELEVRYSRLEFSGADQQDNNRYSATAAWLHNMTPIRNVGIAVSRQHVNFDGSGLGLRNFNLDSAYFVFSSAPRRSAIIAQAGVAQVDDGVDRRSGPAAMLGVERRLSDFSDIAFFARMGYADSADSFRFGRTGVEALELEPQNVQSVSAPFRQTLVNLSYSRRMSSSQLAITPFYSRERFRNNPVQSRRGYGLNLTAAYTLGSSMQLRLNGNAARNDYDAGTQDSTDFSFGAGLLFQFSRSLSLSVDADRYIRSDSAQDFTENRVSVLLRFRPVSSRQRPEISLMRRMRGVGGAATSGFRPEIGNDE
jgi:opacity protein-like surface antigen